jgi:hypothetical protein
MTVKYLDADGATRYRKNSGSGSNPDPDSFYVVTESDPGAHADIGDSTTESAVTSGPGTIISLLMAIRDWALSGMPASLGQKAKTASLPVVLASDQDALQLAAGSALVGGVKVGDSFYSQTITPTSSANMTSLADLTPAPTSGQHTVVESVTISAATPMIVTLKEETTNTILKVFNLTSGNLNAEWNPARGLKLPNVDKKLRAISDTVGQIDVTVISHSAA